MIDLRSDTVAPSPAMRLAMAEAAVGDELFGEDPAARRLEVYAARLLGKPAALFVPTCTIGNAVAVLAHGCDPDRVLLDTMSHIVRREMRFPATLSTLRPTLYDTPDGCPDADDVRRFCTASDRRGLVCLETTHTWRRGLAVSVERLGAAYAEARRHRAPVHLDGARLFHAAAARDVPPAAIAAAADSVVFSLCKGIGAPAGGVLAGDMAFIAAARANLFALGGILRTPGVLAAAGLTALESGWDGLRKDFAAARRLAAAVAGLGVRAEDVPTNVVLFDPSPAGLSGEQFARLALEAGVKVILLEPNLVRLTAHPNLSDADVTAAAAALSGIIHRSRRPLTPSAGTPGEGVSAPA